MKVFDTEIPEVKIIEPTVYEDERGYFFEAYNTQKFEELMGFCPNFCQSNESSSVGGTIRGIHLQKHPFAQGKLIRVVDGSILDVAVDCRHRSKTFGKCVKVELSSRNKLQLWVPAGFGHGFQALSVFALVNYVVDNPYRPEAEVTINCFDEVLNIPWKNMDTVVLNKKDKSGLSFAEYASSVF